MAFNVEGKEELGHKGDEFGGNGKGGDGYSHEMADGKGGKVTHKVEHHPDGAVTHHITVHHAAHSEAHNEGSKKEEGTKKDAVIEKALAAHHKKTSAKGLTEEDAAEEKGETPEMEAEEEGDMMKSVASKVKKAKGE